MVWCVLCLSDSGYKHISVCYEHDGEPSGSKNVGIS